jgi:hypothetical protein
MDNGAYQKYKLENPDVYTPLTTYDFALYKLFFKRKDKKHEDTHE